MSSLPSRYGRRSVLGAFFRFGPGLVPLGAGFVIAASSPLGCEGEPFTSGPGGTESPGPVEIGSSPSDARAIERLDDLVQRFPAAFSSGRGRAAVPALASSESGRLIPSLGVGVGAGTSARRLADDADEVLSDISLPSTADGEVSIVDRASGLGARFSLEGATVARPSVKGGLAIYPRGFGMADLVHRVDRGGVEDLIAFQTRPDTEELRYRIHGEGVAGLRLVDHTLELLDEDGIPRLRVAPPFIVDRDGARFPAEVAVEGCPVDRDPRPTWSRDFEPLQGDSCTMVVSFHSDAYPIVVDPQWEESGFMLHERTHHTATLLPSGEVLIAGGFDDLGAGIASAEIVCPAEVCPPVPIFTPTGNLDVPRGGQSETLLQAGDAVLLTGGRPTRSSSSRLITAELYSISAGTFAATTGTMGHGRAEHTATLLDPAADSMVLIAAGDGVSPTSTAELYDPSLGTFSPTTHNLTVQRRGHVAALLQGSGKVLLAGGISSLGVAVSSAELYDPTDGTFTATPNMTSQRAFATATRLDVSGSVLVAGGTNGVGFYYQTADRYVPNATTGNFVQTAIIMQAPRAYHAATELLGTHTVLVTGGFDGVNLLDTAEVFDQSTTTFTLGSSQMHHARAFHSATRLPSGQVMVAGGGYDPVADTVSLTAAVSTETLKRSNGEPCNVATECASSHCVDTSIGSLCCDDDCGGICQACAQAETTQPNGECHDVVDNTLVKPDCDNAVELKLLCVGGQVQAGNVKQCAPYACDGDHCRTGACTSEDDCSPGGWCSPTGCKFKQDLTTACDTNIQCNSTHCVDGFCCDTSCEGQCEACDVEGQQGVCSQVDGAPHGSREECSGAGTECAGTCGGKHDGCDYQASDCGGATCTSEVETSGICSLTDPGQCVVSDHECQAFACDAAGERCRQSCSSVDDCAEGAVCQNGACTVVDSDKCDGDHTVVRPGSTPLDCSPFRCDGAACINRCNSIDDCVSPSVCNEKGQCVSAPKDPEATSSCAVGISGGDPSASIAAWLGFAALAWYRWDRRRRRASALTGQGAA